MRGSRRRRAHPREGAAVFVSNHSGGRLRRAGVVLAAAGTLAFLFALSACDDGRATRASNQATDMRTVQIPVEGMSCVACAARVKKALTSMDGVSDVEVSLVERTAQVRFDASRRSPDELVAAIEGLGYAAGSAADVLP